MKCKKCGTLMEEVTPGGDSGDGGWITAWICNNPDCGSILNIREEGTGKKFKRFEQWTDKNGKTF